MMTVPFFEIFSAVPYICLAGFIDCVCELIGLTGN